MDMSLFPTKGNLIAAKNTLRLSKQGYDMLDKKRNILIRELMLLIERAKAMQDDINTTFTEAYAALQNANITMSVGTVEAIALAVPREDGITIKTTSVMGVEIPIVEMATSANDAPPYGFYNTSSTLDEAYVKFARVKELIIKLATIENSAYRLAVNIKKTQKRANALKNIILPRYEQVTRDIQNALEEKDREEFGRLKRIKQLKS